jgi:hypothetical protein
MLYPVEGFTKALLIYLFSSENSYCPFLKRLKVNTLVTCFKSVRKSIEKCHNVVFRKSEENLHPCQHLGCQFSFFD